MKEKKEEQEDKSNVNFVLMRKMVIIAYTVTIVMLWLLVIFRRRLHVVKQLSGK
jgi:hypothetical protein